MPTTESHTAALPEETKTTRVETPTPRRYWLFVFKIILPILVLGVFSFMLGVWWLAQPASFTEVRTITVSPGESVSDIVTKVAAAGVVRSELLLYFITQWSYSDETIETGVYEFTPGQNVFSVAQQLMQTTPADELITVTFPEGITVRAMAEIAAARLPNVTVTDFITHQDAVEGELWPETYFVPDSFTTDELIHLLRRSQDEVLTQYQSQIATSELTEQDILTLASILEREANNEESMRTVAGILLRRLSLGMPLQADATIEYVLETKIADLPPGQLATSLREIDSPYNTYLYSGLPPTPIGNPGEQAIVAVLQPIQSEYLFYITGNDGTFHYAKTYDQHLINIEQYLR